MKTILKTTTTKLGWNMYAGADAQANKQTSRQTDRQTDAHSSLIITLCPRELNG